MTATFATLASMDADLVRAGHRPLTPWWRQTLERWYAEPTARTLVARVGRGGAKSHTSGKVALNETLFGDWRVPPGERHFWAFVSRNKDEATQRLLLLESFLRALGIKFDTHGDEIALRDMPRGFRVFACAIGAVSGFRCTGYSCDELAKWAVDGVNPSEEVCVSLNAMCVTHPSSRKILISSPMGVEDYHAQRFDLGDTADQMVAHAPSWVANPAGITEEATHLAEPDPRAWAREYAAEPQASLLAAFDPDTVAATCRPFPRLRYTEPVLALDASAGGACEFASAIVSWAQPPRFGEPIAHTVPPVDQYGNDLTGIYEVDARGNVVRSPAGHPIVLADALPRIRPVFAVTRVSGFENWRNSMGLDHIVDALAEKMNAVGARIAVGDGYEERGLESHFRAHGLRFVGLPTGNANKNVAIKRLRLLMSGRQIIIEDDRTRSQLLAYRELIDGGTMRHQAKSGAKSDRVSVIVNALIAEAEGALPWSPLWVGRKGRGGIPHEAIG